MKSNRSLDANGNNRKQAAAGQLFKAVPALKSRGGQGPVAITNPVLSEAGQELARRDWIEAKPLFARTEEDIVYLECRDLLESYPAASEAIRDALEEHEVASTRERSK